MALIMSSHVAGSRVGGSAQALALTQFKIDPVVIPTVLYGRHPGWGAPGGAQVPIEAFEGMLDGVEANGLFVEMDEPTLQRLRGEGWFVYRFLDGTVRFMCSWATTPEMVEELGAALKKIA